MDVQQFFKKNLKYVTLILLALFFIKTFQGCNRSMTIKKQDKEIVHLSDSLNIIAETTEAALLLQLKDCENYNQKLEYDVKLAEVARDAANERAESILETTKNIKSNTKIEVSGDFSKSDTTKLQ